MNDQVADRLSRVRRRLSRSEWLIRLLRLPVSEETSNEPGLLMIQIDGLARAQMERAMAKGHLPFLRRLIHHQRYRLHTHYSGLPSTTPAVQAELFYGVRCAVPAFSFYDQACQRVFRMYRQTDAGEMESRLKEQGPGLLEGGSAYSDNYTGGAGEAHFCGPMLGLDGLFRRSWPFVLPLLFVLHFRSFLRTAALLVVELVLAVVDCVRGLFGGQDLWKEIKFVPARVAIGVLARELATIGATVDVARGLPIVHLNLLGYDEQSHRRGPSSAFAHWVLRGIDDVVKRLWRAAHRSTRRRYDVWVYSDHGQEDVNSFENETGLTVQEAVLKAFDATARPDPALGQEGRGVQWQRFWSLGLRLPRRLEPEAPAPPAPDRTPHPIVTAMGPIGYIYPQRELSEEEKAECARRLVALGIPLVLMAAGPERARVWTVEGNFVMPDDATRILGPDHPFLEEAARDLVALVHHTDAGLFVISGWRPGRRPLSFPSENGAHGGPGAHETAGFALLPAATPLPETGHDYLRPDQLRAAAREVLRIMPLPDLSMCQVQLPPPMNQPINLLFTQSVFSIENVENHKSACQRQETP